MDHSTIATNELDRVDGYIGTREKEFVNKYTVAVMLVTALVHAILEVALQLRELRNDAITNNENLMQTLNNNR